MPPRESKKPDVELDVRGLNCPLPLLKARKALAGMSAGQTLKLISTDPASVPDLEAFCRMTPHEIVEQSQGGGEYLFLLRKG